MSDQNVNTIHKLQIDGVDYVISATYLENGNSKFDVSDIKTINGESILSENGGNIITSPITFGNNDKDSVILRKTQGEATGKFAVALGADNLLGNIVDIPEGDDLIYVKASGYASHAEGAAHAIGDYSHAEGGGSVDLTSDGIKTVPTAEGKYSHAEGTHTWAKGNTSHAEGNQTIAEGAAAHAEGILTKAIGQYSHVEGHSNITNGENSHAEGYNNTTGVDASSSHVEGASNTTTKPYSHAEGSGNTASGYHSHVEGNKNTASGSASHAEGVETTASGTHSHAQGYKTIASGARSSASGWGTKATNDSEFAVGKYNNSNSDTHFSIGIGTSEDDRKNAFEVKKNGDIYVEGVSNSIQSNINNANTAISKLNGTGEGSVIKTVKDEIAKVVDSAPATFDTLKEIADYIASDKEMGIGIIEKISQLENDSVITKGDYENSIVLKGSDNTVTGKYSVALGSNNSVGGSSSTALGYNNTVNQNCCFATGANNSVSGANSSVDGLNTIVEGHESHAEGSGTKVFGHASHGEGMNSEVYGDFAHVEGLQSMVYAHSSHAEGVSCIAGDMNQKDLVADEKTDGACHAEGVGTNSIGLATHTEGQGTIATGIASHSEGLNTKSGLKGYYFKGVDLKHNKIYLSTTKPETIEISSFTSVFENWSDNPYEVNDIVSIINGDVYYDLKVIEIKGNTIKVENLPFSSISEVNEMLGDSNYTVFCLSQYRLGVVNISLGSHAEGHNTRSFGIATHSEGHGTIAKNVGEHASGIYNVSSGDTQFSIGVGTSEDDRKNAFEVKQNGDIYIKGIGGYTGNNHVESEDVAAVIQKLENKHPIIGLIHNDIENSKSSLDLIYSLIKSSNLAPYIQGFVSNITSENIGAIVGSYTIISVGIANGKAAAILKVIGGPFVQGLNSYLVNVYFAVDDKGNYSDLEVVIQEEFNSSNVLNRISELENIINN